jgi:uncharacterized protein
MPKDLFRRWLPSKERLHNDRVLRLFGAVLHRPNLWHLNRHSVARAFGIGLFWAMIPMPFQMIPAAACAIWFRANLAFSIALVWISNPLTMPPIFYAQYRFGKWLLGSGVSHPLEMSWASMRANLGDMWLPLYVGAVIAAVVVSGISYGVIRTLWRWNLSRRWAKRRLRGGATTA